LAVDSFGAPLPIARARAFMHWRARKTRFSPI
jgi:hypothetical protein